MPSSEKPLWLWLLFPAVTMGLGWALRGYIGGGPLGAMIPGAMVAMVLGLLLGRDDGECGLIAAFGAVGIGFGGQVTYGQTIGLTFKPETFWWGLLGFGLKGAIWGLLGGAALGVALVRDRYKGRDLAIGWGLLALATYLGWKLINEPKLIYFSDRFNKPRAEIWAGLLLGALALLVWLGRRGGADVPWHFAWWGALGGGLGFGGGAWGQVVAKPYLVAAYVDYWKVCEFIFGFSLGLAYGYAAWRRRHLAGAGHVRPLPSTAHWCGAATGVLVSTAGLFLDANLHSRLSYTILGAALLSMALCSEALAWQIAVTMTYCAFAMDFLKDKPNFNRVALWTLVVLSTLLVGWVTARWRQPRPLLLLLMWSAVLVSMFKSFVPLPASLGGQAVTEAAFAVLAVISTWMVLREADYVVS